MSHAWGVFYCPAHDYETDHKLIETMQPSVVTIQDGGDNHYAWVRAAAPKTIILAREWALGNQWGDLERDPVATGKHHASEWAKKRDKLKFDPEMARVAPVNEPECWPTLDPNKYSPEQREAQRGERVKKINAYTVTFASECEKYGLRAALLKLSVGWPGNTGPDTPPNWKEYEETYKNVNWKRHTMCLHEYFADLGPAESWGWWGGRARKMPWDIPYIIGETGFEMAVKKAVEPAYRGWTRYISRAQYAQMMLDYCNWMAVDPRLLGVCFFMLDHQDPQWASQDYSACWQEIIAIKPQLRMISTDKFVPLPASVLSPDKFKQPGAGTPSTPPPPVVVVPPVTPPTPPPATTLAGKIVKALPNDGSTYVFGQAPEGAIIYFAWLGNAAIDGIQAGPHSGYENWAKGYFNIPLFNKGLTPCVGDWDVWCKVGDKTSPRVSFHSDGKGGKFNQFEVNFAFVTVTPPVTPPVEPPPVTPPVPAASSLWQWPLKSVAFTQYWGVPQPKGFSRRQRSTDTETYIAHEGLDFRAAVGTDVMSVADGTVLYTGSNATYGNYICVRHGPKNSQWDSFFAHLQSVPTLKAGAIVKRGQVIAKSGNTGTGGKDAHLHMELWSVGPDGKEIEAPGSLHEGCIDPVAFFEGLERGAAMPPFVQK